MFGSVVSALFATEVMERNVKPAKRTEAVHGLTAFGTFGDNTSGPSALLGLRALRAYWDSDPLARGSTMHICVRGRKSGMDPLSV